MAQEYAKVLAELGQNFVVGGRSELSASKFTDATGIAVTSGGVAGLKKHSDEKPRAAIVSVSVDQLAEVSIELLELGVDRLLIEKPGALSITEFESLKNAARATQAQVWVGYNRRFYESVRVARTLIEDDGGVTSFSFDLTEWSHIISKNLKSPRVMQNWFLANTSHITDLAWFIGGKPTELKAHQGGDLEWHPAGSMFVGCGVTENNALFSYHGDWASAGRWSLEFCTAKRKLIFCPLEELHTQQLGTITVEKVAIDDQLDKLFKPGLYRQVESFLNDDTQDLCTLDEQIDSALHCKQMAGYG